MKPFCDKSPSAFNVNPVTRHFTLYKIMNWISLNIYQLKYWLETATLVGVV